MADAVGLTLRQRDYKTRSARYDYWSYRRKLEQAMAYALRKGKASFKVWYVNLGPYAEDLLGDLEHAGCMIKQYPACCVGGLRVRVTLTSL
jgi:hypothetical protein